ncbi:hypothetical protein KY389_09570 [Paracoccus bogoriensis]|uniref:hypothetical protein n=1 Tax=Paracoccus bogoriensis TaxID=242065 RepID=UPI001CA59094|nr:hypothetical protein [Paracoccus bogoriensis]MBW7056943.1 hypothetical protein [Paracoccus bogoriensis]
MDLIDPSLCHMARRLAILLLRHSAARMSEISGLAIEHPGSTIWWRRWRRDRPNVTPVPSCNRGGSVDLNRFQAVSRGFASVTPPPLWVSAG